MNDNNILILVSRLRSFNENECEHAAESIKKIILSDKNQIQSVIDADGITALFKALDSENLKTYYYSSNVLNIIINNSDEHFQLIYEAGLIPVLTELLNSSLEKKKECALRILNDVCLISRKIVMEPKILTAITDALSSSNYLILKYACQIITNFAYGRSDDENFNSDDKDAVIRAGLVPVLIKLLNSENTEICALSIRAIAHLTTGNVEQKQIIIDENAIPILVKLLSSSDIFFCDYAALAISYIFCGGTDLQKKSVMDAGAIQPLVGLINIPDEYVVEVAICLLQRIVSDRKEEIQTVINSCAVFSIIVLLKSSNEVICDAASSIIAEITENSEEHSEIVVAAGGIYGIQRLLEPSKLLRHEAALFSMYNISKWSTKQRQAIAKCDEAVLQLVKCITPDDVNYCGLAVEILANIAYDKLVGIQAVIKANAIPSLVQLLKTDNLYLCTATLFTLQNIAKGSAEQKAIVQTVALHHIANLLDSNIKEICKLTIILVGKLIRGTSSNEKRALQCLFKQLKHTDLEIVLIATFNIYSISLAIFEENICVFDTKDLFRLVKLLKSPDINVLYYASEAISHIILKIEHAEILFKTKVIPSILNLLQSYSTDEHMCAHAIGALRNVAYGSNEFKDLVIQEEVIPIMIKYLNHVNLDIVKAAAGVLRNITEGTNEHRQIVIDAELVPYFVKFLHSINLDICKEALAFFNNIAAGTGKQIQKIVNYGAVDSLDSLLKSPNEEIVELAKTVLHNIFLFKEIKPGPPLLQKSIIIYFGKKKIIEIEPFELLPFQKEIELKACGKERALYIFDKKLYGNLQLQKSIFLPAYQQYIVRIKADANGYGVYVSKLIATCVYKKRDLKIDKHHSKIPTISPQFDMNSDVVGIHFGRLNCCAAVIRRNGIETVALDNVERLLPSYVAFDEEKAKCGQIVLNRLRQHANSTVFNIMQILGKTIDKINVDDKWSFSLVNDTNSVKIELQSHKENISKYPEEVAAVLLKHIKDKAETFQAKKLKNVVITYPTSFTKAQKDSVYIAAYLAGWEKVHLVYDYLAAAAAHIYKYGKPENSNVLHINFGSDSLDVSTFLFTKYCASTKNAEKPCEEVSKCYKTGGKDFDKVLFSYIMQQFKDVYDISASEKNTSKLQLECQTIKETLSVEESYSLEVEDYDLSKSGHILITREKFESLSEELLKNIEAGIALPAYFHFNNKIDKVTQSGGGCRMPMFQQMLKKLFPNAEIIEDKNPDEMVAVGAACFALSIYENSSSTRVTSIVNNLVTVDVERAKWQEGTDDRYFFGELIGHFEHAMNITRCHKDFPTEF